MAEAASEMDIRERNLAAEGRGCAKTCGRTAVADVAVTE